MSETVSPRTKAAQAEASDPARSVFVSANAGSGKTHVLTERVVRLLLSGAEPAKILCLTYTKAAAAEMANRVYARLAGFATASARALDADLRDLLARGPEDGDRVRARRLFACALETPGGLKIQTIHAFCEAILHQFPLEAGVPGHFEVLDEAESALLLAEARRRLTSGETGEGRAEAFAEALALAGEKGLDALLVEIVRRRDAIRRHLDEAGGLSAAGARLARALGLAPGADEASVLADATPSPGFDVAFLRALLAAARSGGKPSDAALAERIEAHLSAAAPGERFATLRALCLTEKNEPRKRLATKAVAETLPDLDARLAECLAHLETVRDRLASLRLLAASRAALVLADAFERDYAALKRRRGRLDFEDLVVSAADLLTRSEASGWVHYKLDQGIDHVLVDEAQDTSPRQWEVMRALVDEFFVGQSARTGVRTLFAVGDEKQSIYSFQGASPSMFAEERRAVERRAGGAGLPFSPVELHQSFRSAGAVLEAVDRVFADPANRRGLSAEDRAPSHETVRAGAPGLVEIWPPFVASVVPEPEDWLEPVDTQPADSPANRLARRIAETIRGWLGDAVAGRKGPRRLGPGDVLVLVRKRSPFVDAMGKALRDLGIPVAGADRLLLTDHIAVCDLLSLGRAAGNLDDELSLAECLKSPFFDFSDDELMALALSRDASEPLMLALRRLGEAEGTARVSRLALPGIDPSALAEKAAVAVTRLDALRDRTGFAGPFGFFARVLGPEGGRARLLARLGADAGEVIDAFLDLALAHEEARGAGLDAFLAELAAAPPEIKREMDVGRGEVRIMTVHASKGLEAPVVFLVDPGSAPFHPSHGAKLVAWEGQADLAPGAAPPLLWRASPEVRNRALDDLGAAEKGAAEDEYRRLLYVGMTRAADRLVLCGTAGARGPSEECWLRLAERALEGACEAVLDEDGARLCLRFGSTGRAAKIAAAQAGADPAPAPLDLSPLPPEPRLPRPLVPSSLGASVEADAGGGSPVLGGEGDADAALAIRRGSALHKLLQILPEIEAGTRQRAALDYLDATGAIPDADARQDLVETVRQVMEDSRFSAAFASGSRAEVPVAGTLHVGDRSVPVSGSIDRLAVDATRALIVDYKTLRPAPRTLPEVPEAYLLQLALYRALLIPLYPDRRVEVVLLFTEGPHWMEIPDDILDAALERALGGGASASRGAGEEIVSTTLTAREPEAQIA